MDLVVDTNILISFFRENPVRSIIINSDFFNLGLFSPEYAIEELNSNISGLIKYSRLPILDIKSALEELRHFISIIPSSVFKEFESKAKQLSPHDKDMPFFALALKLDCPIWSNEPAFKKQSSVKVFTTAELIKEIGL